MIFRLLRNVFRVWLPLLLLLLIAISLKLLGFDFGLPLSQFHWLMDAFDRVHVEVGVFLFGAILLPIWIVACPLARIREQKHVNLGLGKLRWYEWLDRAHWADLFGIASQVAFPHLQKNVGIEYPPVPVWVKNVCVFICCVNTAAMVLIPLYLFLLVFGERV